MGLYVPPDYEAGQASAFAGHTEPSPSWSNELFHTGWIDQMMFQTRMTPRQRQKAAQYRKEIVQAYRGM